MTQPIVSIVTTALNAEKYIAKTLNSVLEQTYPHIEYIVIDGGSSDRTVDIIREYQDRLAYWTSEPDSGMYDGINKGFSHATGKIFSYLNSDDCYYPETIQRVVDTFISTKADFVFGDTAYIDAHGHPLYTYRAIPTSPERVRQIRRPTMSQQATFWTADLHRRLGGFDTAYRYVSDFKLMLQMGLDPTLKSTYIPQVLAEFRLHPQAITSRCAHDMAREAQQVLSQLGFPALGPLEKFNCWIGEIPLKCRNFSAILTKKLTCKTL